MEEQEFYEANHKRRLDDSGKIAKIVNDSFNETFFMDNKYYTPTIDEFHVGFEYERSDSGYKYFKDVFPRALDLNLFYQHPERFLSYFRVKLLDHEDIVELGWKAGGIFRTDTNEYSICEHGNKWLIGKRVNDMDYVPIFIGTIRNKSELKKLMKQLGIL